MRIKLDENLPAELVDDLHGAGHDVDSVVSEHLAGQPDTVVANAARTARRILITLDKGFGDTRMFPPTRHSGIVLFRLRANGRAAVRREVMSALPRLSRRTLAGRLVVVTRSSIRSRS
jgi:predicted nuclease of predicted toxin-antitoxin system